MKHRYELGNEDQLVLADTAGSLEIDHIKSLEELRAPRPGMQKIARSEEATCNLYTVIRDPEKNEVLFVLPYIRYKENDPL